jgi:hypothetical protein
MIFGAGDQNKKLSSAAGRPKDTSYRKQNADAYSGKISSSKSSANKTIGESKATVRKSNSAKLKGSYEGLQNSSSTVLQMDGVGYDNKAIQNARYNKNQVSHNNENFNFNMAPVDKNYSIMDNYSSMSATGSSSNKISNIVKNNMMFK